MHFDNISFEHFSGLRSANLSVDLWNLWYNMAQQSNTTGTSQGPKFHNPCNKGSTSDVSDISGSALAFLIKQGRLLLSFIDFIKRK